jgi:hypothetical protein
MSRRSSRDQVAIPWIEMPDRRDPSSLPSLPPPDQGRGRSPWRFVPLAAVVALSVLILAMGWHRHLTFETFVRQHAVLRDFIARDLTASIAAYVALYVAVVALSLPGALFLTVAGGIMFGAILGGMAALVGATVGLRRKKLKSGLVYAFRLSFKENKGSNPNRHHGMISIKIH